MKTLAALLLSSNFLFGLEIEVRYEPLDSTGFFDNPEAREAMEVAAAFYAELIVDELEAINPEEFQIAGSFAREWTPTYLEPGQRNPIKIDGATNMVVPKDTLIIFVGARELDSTAQGGPGGVDFGRGGIPPLFPWLNQILSRGEEGAVTLLSNGDYSRGQSDSAPWGGSIFFDTGTEWNFSTTDASAAPGADFISVALHEIGHVLGLGAYISQSSGWSSLIGYDANNYPLFGGPLATASHGRSLYLYRQADYTDYSHWSDFRGTPTLQSHTLAVFGRSHGELQEPLMMPLVSSTTADQFRVPTDLDIAALQDIGWEIRLAPEDFSVEPELDGEISQIGIPTTTGVNYLVNRGETLDGLAPAGETIEGDGSVQVWTDPVAGSRSAFYQVEALAPNEDDRSAEANKAAAQSKEKSGVVAPSVDSIPFVPTSHAPEQCGCVSH